MSTYKHRRSTNPGTAFPALQAGEIATNIPNRQLAVGDTSGTALLLLAVRYFDAAAQYAIGDYVVQGGQLYRAKVAVSPGAFNAANWDALAPADVTKSYVDTQDALRVAKAGDTMTGNLTVTKPGGVPQLRVDGDTNHSEIILDSGTGMVANLRFHRNDVLRWIAQMNSAAEGGSNAGSDFMLYRCDDAGG